MEEEESFGSVFWAVEQFYYLSTVFANKACLSDHDLVFSTQRWQTRDLFSVLDFVSRARYRVS